MYIDVATVLLKWLTFYVEKYMEEEFENVITYAQKCCTRRKNGLMISLTMEF